MNPANRDPGLVSAIVVVKNGARYLEAALRSIMAQDYRPIEVIVVDGHSNDDSAGIAQQFSEVRHLLQPNDGLAAARNIGIGASRGEFIAFLDHDDLWLPHKLSEQVEYLQNYPEVLYCVTCLQFFHEPDHLLRSGFMPESFTTAQVGVTPSGLMARCTAFECNGLFNIDMRIGCDADWFARARDARLRMGVLPHVLTLKRVHADNLSANVRTNKQDLLTMVRQSIARKRDEGRLAGENA